MAVPTISLVSPASGLSGGQQMIEITGTGFRLPNAPPVSGPVPVPPPSVSVTFAGRPSPRVAVLSATRLRVFTPQGPPGLAAVTVANLDANGDPIVGESVTSVGAFTFNRPDLASREWTLLRVVRALIRLYKEQLLENTVHTTHTDYDDDTADGLNVVAISKLPAVVISGPQVKEDRFFSQNDRRFETLLDGSVRALPVAWTATASFTIAVFSSSEMELLALLQAFPILVNGNDYLTVDRVGSDPSQGSVAYEMDFAEGGDPRVLNTPNNSNVRVFTAQIEVRGIDLDPIEDIAIDTTTPLADVIDPATGLPFADVTIDGSFTQFVLGV